MIQSSITKVILHNCVFIIFQCHFSMFVSQKEIVFTFTVFTIQCAREDERKVGNYVGLLQTV